MISLRKLRALIKRLEKLDRENNLTGDGYLWLQQLKAELDSRTP